MSGVIRRRRQHYGNGGRRYHFPGRIVPQKATVSVSDAVAATQKLEKKVEAVWKEMQRANNIVLKAKEGFRDYRAVADGYEDIIRGVLQLRRGLNDALDAMK